MVHRYSLVDPAAKAVFIGAAGLLVSKRPTPDTASRPSPTAGTSTNCAAVPTAFDRSSSTATRT